MPALGEQMQLGRKVVLFVFQIEPCRGRRILAVIMGAGQKHGRCIRRHAEASPELCGIGLIQKAAAVDHDAEIRQSLGCRSVAGQVRQQIARNRARLGA